ncbi:hypothetical protein BT63DRAFT_51957 [Microthyrium microscopicum]|uniref:Uncharacterized protein n=1 Tax=Microthyrium microscopicum TaxID=703497 RepID=A0A6A6U1K1_9PEZI|nr:hypothetical protein BT63DRAFT_51957 [Microthyrium microscopicum]
MILLFLPAFPPHCKSASIQSSKSLFSFNFASASSRHSTQINTRYLLTSLPIMSTPLLTPILRNINLKPSPMHQIHKLLPKIPLLLLHHRSRKQLPIKPISLPRQKLATTNLLFT